MLDSRCFCDSSAACFKKEKNLLCFKQLFFFKARPCGMCPHKTAEHHVVSSRDLFDKYHKLVYTLIEGLYHKFVYQNPKSSLAYRLCFFVCSEKIL